MTKDMNFFKKCLSTIVILFVTIFNLNAQDHNYNDEQVATTMEIYNYVTKGYAFQQASGLDMKKGYFIWEKLTRSTNSSDGKQTVKINALIQAVSIPTGTGTDSSAYSIMDSFAYETTVNENYKVCAWMLIYEKSGSQPIYFCIPTQSSDSEVWTKSFTDLRDAKLSTSAYLAYSWALYNLVGALSNDYDDICFTESTLITMADGTQKFISEIKNGDLVLCYDNFTLKTVVSEVSELIVHNDKEYNISRVTVNNQRFFLASSEKSFVNTNFAIEATVNHPIVTTEGIKTIGELMEGDILLYYDNNSNAFFNLPVIKTEKNINQIDKVYNIRLTNNINYIANNLVVLMK
jgi:hypothetical protein